MSTSILSAQEARQKKNVVTQKLLRVPVQELLQEYICMQSNSAMRMVASGSSVHVPEENHFKAKGSRKE